MPDKPGGGAPVVFPTVGACCKALHDAADSDESLAEVIAPFDIPVSFVRNPASWADARKPSAELLEATINGQQALMTLRMARIPKLFKIDGQPLTEDEAQSYAVFDAQAPAARRLRKLRTQRVAELPREVRAVDQLVEQLFALNGISVIYGGSNSGKTFMAVDLAAAVSQGAEWFGRRTEQGLVLYLASEAPRSVEMRFQAYREHHGIELPNVFLLPEPVNLFADDIDTESLIALAARLKSEHGLPVRLIIGDTLSRMSAGANENDGRDMMRVLANVQRIQAGIGAQLILIHHSGKDESKGSRGWSGLRAFVDTEAEVVSGTAGGDEDGDRVHSIEFTKQRDLQSNATKLVFKLQQVLLPGQDNFGNAAQSCILLNTDKPAPVRADRQPRGPGRPSYLEGMIVQYLSGCSGRSATRSEIISGIGKSQDDKAVYKAVRRMIDTGKLTEGAGKILTVAHNERAAA